MNISNTIRSNSPLNYASAKDRSLVSEGVHHVTDPDTGVLTCATAGDYRIALCRCMVTGTTGYRVAGLYEESRPVAKDLVTDVREAVELFASKF